MDATTAKYCTGIVGISTYVLTMAVMPLWFVHSGAPPVDNVLTRALINMLVLIGVILFWIGFREIVRQRSQAHVWLTTVSLVAATIHVTLTFAAESMQVGSVLREGGGVDPTTIGGGAEESLLILGPIARLLSVVALAAAGLAILKSRILPKWTAWLALIVALFHAALLPTTFSTTNPANFYSINGWNIPVAGGLYLLWVLMVSIVFIARKNRT